MNSQSIGRRRFVGGMVGLATITVLTVSIVSLIKSSLPMIKTMASGEFQPFIILEGPKKGEEVTVKDFTTPGVGMNVLLNDLVVALMRLDESRILKKKYVHEGGFMAFSSVCKHLGCAVFYKKDEDIVYCPCHEGRYDPYDGSKILFGPPPEPLNPIPIKIENDVIKGGPEVIWQGDIYD